MESRSTEDNQQELHHNPIENMFMFFYADDAGSFIHQFKESEYTSDWNNNKIYNKI